MVLLVVACAHPPMPSATEPKGPLRFAVLGDRTDEPDDQLWQRVVGSVAARGAPLVVTVGDLVDEPDNPVEWTRALTPLAALARVEHTPGNHDILDERTATTFVAQTGQATYRSFDVQGVHFVVLDSSIADRWDQLPEAQRTWFDADLAAHVGAPIVVFSHKPFWAQGVAQGKPDELHQKLAAAGVLAMFTGHWHQHLEGTYDGVHYVGVGNSGGASPGLRQVGTLAEHVEVSIAGRDVRVETVVDGSVVAPVTIADEAQLFLLQRGAVRARLGPAGLELHVENVAKVPLETTLFLGASPAWTPARSELVVQLAPGEVLDTHVDGVVLAGWPLPRVWLDWPLPDRGPTRFEVVVDHARELTAPSGDEPVLDGILGAAEWAEAAAVEPLVTNLGERSEVHTRVWVRHTPEAMVFAARTDTDPAAITAVHHGRDGSVVFDDRVGVLLGWADTQLAWFYVNPNGGVWDLRVDRTAGVVDRSWNGVLAQASVDATGWSMEARVPYAALGLDTPPTDWAFDVRVRDNAAQTHGQFTPAFSSTALARLGTLHLAP